MTAQRTNAEKWMRVPRKLQAEVLSELRGAGHSVKHSIVTSYKEIQGEQDARAQAFFVAARLLDSIRRTNPKPL